MTKMLLVHGIHLREIIHIRQEHIHLDHRADARTGRGQDRGNVLDALARFVRYAPRHEGAGGVGGDLARDVDLVRRFDGLGLWGNRC